jgi:CubicO group peptidase (beta-lactamase class C family)
MRTKLMSLARVALLGAALVAWCSSAAMASLDLEGVWTSEQTFGPVIGGGEVVLSRRASGWSAKIGNENASSPSSAGVATFGFSDGSELHVRASSSGVEGQWVQPATATTGYRFASPVRFEEVDEGVWSGHVHPLSDVQHFVLIIQPAKGGGLNAFIRNPESNEGARVGTRRVVVVGNDVHLQGAGSADVVGHITGSTMDFHFAGYPGTFVFDRSREPAADATFVYHVPIRNGDGWATGSLGDVGLDSAKIAALIGIIQAPATSAASPYIQSLQIARHGELVLDEYFNGFSIDRPHDVRSAGKSVTTLLVGKTIADGATIGPGSLVYPLFGQYAPFANADPRKQSITVADLMTMSSGYACDDNDDASPGNEDTMQSQSAQPDWYRYTLDLPMANDPGSRAVYCSADINLLGGIIAKGSRRALTDYFYDSFAAPMQFGPYAMWLTPPPLSTAYMGGGDYFLPRDFLKFGELFLDHGQWNGKRIIDEAWLAASAAPHASLSGPGDYGYGWHLYTYNVGGRSIKAISAGGNGGQLLFVFPQLDMTVMITAANYGQYPVWQKFVTGLVPDYIIAAAR